MGIKSTLTGIVIAVALAACTTVPVTPVPIEAALEEALVSAPPPPPPGVADALLPAAEQPIATLTPRQERFDVNVTNTPAKAFFAGLVDGTATNMVVHPKVSGKISLTMKDVTIGQVLETVREVYGYEMRRSGNGYIVMPATLQSRLFNVDYLDIQRSGVSRMRVSSGQVSDGGQSSGSSQSNSNSNSSNSEGGQGDNGSNSSVTGSRVDTTYAVDFWSDLEMSLGMIVGNGDGRKVVVNRQTGVIMVRAMPEELRSVDAYLEIVQVTAQRQVLLEAKVVEVELNDTFQSGINWLSVAQSSSGHNFAFGQSAPPGSGAFRGDTDSLGGAPVTIAPGVKLAGFDTQTLGGAFTMAFDIGDFNALIELLEAQGSTRVLSSPRVSTLNNQKAVIKAGTDEFFVTDVSSNTVTGTSSTTSRDVELTPFFSGIALDVTPQISADNYVTLHVHPTVSEVTDQQKNLTVSGETDSLPLAVSEIRESDTVVRARSGQIIVIGGLMRDSSRREDFGTPWLGKLPGIGGLFSSKRSVSRKSELVILLKPVVIANDRDWSTAARQSLERIRDLDQR